MVISVCIIHDLHHWSRLEAQATFIKKRQIIQKHFKFIAMPVGIIGINRMKKILLISYNFFPELTGIGKYNGEMIDWLLEQGHACSVVTTYPYYPDWKIQEKYRSKRFFFSTESTGGNDRLKVYRCPVFVPNNPSALKRILLELSFFITAFLRLISLLMVHRYDVVITVAPSFHVGLLGVICKKLRNAIFLYHIQDLQIEAARDLNMIKSKRIIRAMLFIEKKVLDNATLVSTISDQMVAKVKLKTKTAVALFPNWTNTNFFFPVTDRSSIKTAFGFRETDKIVLYSGAIGEKQGLEAILHCARCNKANRDLKFVICGNGPYKKELERKTEQLGLNNITFFPLQPLSSFNHFLNLADVHLIIQKGSASDFVMPSKLGAILAVGGTCVVTANSGTALYSLVQNHRMGILVNADDPEALEQGISSALTIDASEIKSNARSYAEKVLSINAIMDGLMNELTMRRPDVGLREFKPTYEAI